MNRKKKKNRLYYRLQLPVSQGLEGRRFFLGSSWVEIPAAILAMTLRETWSLIHLLVQ